MAVPPKEHSLPFAVLPVILLLIQVCKIEVHSNHHAAILFIQVILQLLVCQTFCWLNLRTFCIFSSQVQRVSEALRCFFFFLVYTPLAIKFEPTIWTEKQWLKVGRQCCRAHFFVCQGPVPALSTPLLNPADVLYHSECYCFPVLSFSRVFSVADLSHSLCAKPHWQVNIPFTGMTWSDHYRWTVFVKGSSMA